MILGWALNLPISPFSKEALSATCRERVWGSEKGVCELQGAVLLLSSKYPSGVGRGEGGLRKLSLTHRSPAPGPHSEPRLGRDWGSGWEQEREQPQDGRRRWVSGSWLLMRGEW